MKKALLPLFAVPLLLFFGCKKNVENNQPPEDAPQYSFGYLDSNHFWGTKRPTNSTSKVQLDNNTVHNGKYSAVIIARGDSGKYGTGIRRIFTPDYFFGNRVHFSYWAKSKDITGKVWALAIAVKRDKDMPGDLSNNPFDKFSEFIEESTGIDLESEKAKIDKWAFGYDGCFEPLHIDGTFDWKQYHLELDIPIKTDYVMISFQIKGKGSLWIDDITYEKVKKLPIDSGYVDRSEYLTPLKGLDFEQ